MPDAAVVPSVLEEPSEAPAGQDIDPALAATARSTRRVVVAALVGVSVFTAALGTVWVAKGVWNPSWGSSAHAATCPAEVMAPAAPDEVKVNVYNSTEQVGKATQAAHALRQRGFRVGTVTNAELPDGIRSGTGTIVAGPDAMGKALAIQRQVPGAMIQLQPERTDGAVDLVLGEAFAQLRRADKVSDAPGRVRCVAPHAR